MAQTKNAPPTQTPGTAAPGNVNVLALDPGSSKTGFVLWNGTSVLNAGIFENAAIRKVVAKLAGDQTTTHIAIETIANVHTSAGKEIMDTAIWSGRFLELWELMRGAGKANAIQITRTKAASFVGGRSAGDKEVMAALKERFGQLALTSHCWAALAVAVCVYDGLVKAGPGADFSLMAPSAKKAKKKTTKSVTKKPKK